VLGSLNVPRKDGCQFRNACAFFGAAAECGAAIGQHFPLQDRPRVVRRVLAELDRQTVASAPIVELEQPDAVVAVDIQPAKPKNPPLERANAASLLDAVKPGKPQVIHGVKVARVGAGYSIDRMVLSRELAIKRLEGGKVGNPKPNPKAVKAKAKPKPKTTAKPKKPATRKPAKTAAKVAYI